MTDASPSTDQRPSVARTGSRWSRLCLKELRETLRDRRTLITLVLMPLLVYPILSMVIQRSLLSLVSGEKQRVVIGVKSPESAELLREQLLVADLYLQRRELAESKLRSEKAGEEPDNAAVPSDERDGNAFQVGDQIQPPDKLETLSRSDESAKNSESDTGASEAPPQLGIAGLVRGKSINLDVGELVFVQHDDLAQQVRNGKIDLGVLTPKESELGRYELVHQDGSPIGTRTLEFVEERFKALNEFVLRQRLMELGQSPRMKVESTRQTIEVDRRDDTLSTIVPMILILMTVTGAVYPAIDLTAGERERGTLEMLMASPVSRLKLLMAKYVAVVTVAFLTALVNLVAMAITLQATGIGRMIFGEEGLGFVRIIQILSLLVLFAAFFSAVLLALTSFARSFKEAQAYLIPLMLLSLGPGIVSLLPGLELRGILAITPISNMVLLARDLCGGQVDPFASWIAILSTSLYTLAAVGVAAKIFGADAVMSGGQGELRNLFFNSNEPTKAPVSSVSGALLCLATLFPIYFVASGFLAQLPLSMTGRLVVSGIATSLVFGGVPAFAAWLQGLDPRAFGFHKAPVAAFTVAILLGFTLWPIAHEIVLFGQWLGLSSITPEVFESAERAIEELSKVSPLLILVSMAFVPAFFEELFFRGYLFHALRNVTTRRTTILASAALFGLFHVVNQGALSPERFLPSAFMGLVLGWLCYQSHSILPGIILHACHNGLLMMMVSYKDQLADWGFGVEEGTHMPTTWLAISIGSLLFGILFIGYLSKTHVSNHKVHDGSPSI